MVSDSSAAAGLQPACRFSSVARGGGLASFFSNAYIPPGASLPLSARRRGRRGAAWAETKKRRNVMATVNLKFKASSVEGKPGSLYFQVIHRRTVRQVCTGYHVYPAEWDASCGRVTAVASPPERVDLVRAVREHVQQDRWRLLRLASEWEELGISFTADDLAASFREKLRQQSFKGFMQGIARQLRDSGQVRTSETYATTLKSFLRFTGDRDVRLDDLDRDLMLRYEAWLKRSGLVLNTVSFYMRILRATYNRAVERGLTEQRSPFRGVYTGVARTLKRAVPIQVIRRMKALDLSDAPLLDFSRDMFLFSFYTRGMSFVDMAYLRRNNLLAGVLVYCRRKTGQRLFVKWERCMQEIVDKYDAPATGYLLPIIRRSGDERAQYRNALHLVNCKLKTISAMMGLPVGLTMYVARHSWASIARSKRIPISVISEGMGHDSESTTQIYLASLDHSVVDRANELILRNI